ncbi:hypothetical protein fh0823_19190 [Francisella halioticida]|uniref:GH18 domain-containing protein n=1 Tax=Francisella halioticida TaxID=549298 RepID=A0ABM6M1V4_9GAMM|nr:glycosyl hydrolase family 18 protein [Francisella halioticida]ASG68806.1 hypothetical protein CDV26_10815 [Francisella halioticida]BCD91780.1 hypothetical protein fh0823_19190 [Francisella halioticida]
MSDKQINELAENIVAFLDKYNIDGIVYSFKKYTSPNFIDKLSTKLKKINPNIIISIAPSVKDYKLVTTGRSNDYDKTIQDGNIDYIMLLEFNTYPEYDPNFIFDSYEKIIKNTKIPLKTKIYIVEPTTAVAGGVDTIYPSQGDATTSLTTQQAVKLMLP